MVRRSLKLMAVGALGALLVAGCAPPQIDGDLVNNWAAMPQPESWSPKADECHASIYEGENLLAQYLPIACDQPHSWETFHVGTLPADRVNVPPVNSVDRAATFDQCSAEADKFLSGSWRDARLSLQVLYPSEEAWSGGGRWFRCDLAHVDTEAPVVRQESLRGALAGSHALARGCYAKEGQELAPVACDKPHQYEYVGTWFAPPATKYAEVWGPRNDRVHRECRSLVARFAKVPDDSDLRARTGTQLIVPNVQQWGEGDRGVGCMLWLDRKLTSSLKGAGTKGLPINYR